MPLKSLAKKHRAKFLILPAIGVMCFAALTGCVAGPGYYDADVYVPGPDVMVFGGYPRGHFDAIAAQRGYNSRSAAHFPRPPASHPAPSHGGGGGGSRGHR